MPDFQTPCNFSPESHFPVPNSLLIGYHAMNRLRITVDRAERHLAS